VPIEVILSNFGDFARGSQPSKNDRLVKMLTGVAAWKLNKVRADLYGADLYGANLTGAYNLGSTYNLNTTIGEPASLPTGWEYKSGLIVKKS
jgi:hypothetical protein